MAAGEYRLRICYPKAGRLRYLSHLELVHTLERCIRRAGLPFAITQGFSPHMKAAFGPALPVGTGGEREYLDVWVTRYTEASDVLKVLRAVTPEDLSPIEVGYVAMNVPSLTAALTIGQYRVELEGREYDAEEVHAGIVRLMAEGSITVEQKGKQKVYDLARSIPKEPRVHGQQDGVTIEMTVRMGPEGSLRPEAFVKAALSLSGMDAPVVRTTRTDALVESEEGVWSRPV